MFVFAVLGFILFIVIPAVYVYSFFKPSKFGIRTAGNPSGKYSRMNFTGLIALVWFAVLFLGSVFTDPEATENVAAKNSEPTTVSKQEPKPEQVESNEKVAVATPLKEESVKEAKKEVVATEKEVIAPKK
ncbi:hypothetical protein DLE54_11885 (plasmid) [Psychrobacter sp. YP14]|uniref:hypothetical protein n=1 Tax=Psychrobacter sp. YP14 TaxID=2203895 RepID=UPI000D7E1385|nr:hypothetical protein [Psychrobacter sp. YP14]AWT50320.1 hypothetical protein DLE54_11885 [Psychrobacter sp. YP14]